MGKKKMTMIVDLSDVKIRFPIPKPGDDHGDKKKYNRKKKHKNKVEE